MSHWKQLLATLTLISLAACGGGGGGAGTPVVGGGGGNGTVSDLVITFNKDTINNSGTDSVTATITAVDASRRGVKDAAVSVAVDSNAVISATATRTNDSGSITATVGIGSDKTTRNITVTATSGAITKTAVLSVVPGQINPTAADLTLALNTNKLLNGSTATVTATATAVDANRNVVAGIPVVMAVDAGATIEPSGTVTNSLGVVTGTVRIGADRTNRVVTVTATSGSLTKRVSFLVDGAKLFASGSPLVTVGSGGNTIEYTLLDSNSVAMANELISVSGTGLPAQTGQRTDINGKFRYSYTAPSTAGNITIVATAAGAESTQVVTVSAGATVPAATESPRSATVTPTPSVVAVNSANSATNQVELRALFIGADNRPIKNMRARFDLVGGATETYGTVNVVGNYAYSDENGIARAVFVPGTRESPTNGVTVRMCYDRVDFDTPAPNSCAGATNLAFNTLTVTLGAISVNIQTNNLIRSGRDNLTYIKDYAVMVVDTAGRAVSNAEITPLVDLEGYYKGVYRWNELAGQWLKQPVSETAPDGTLWGSLGPDERYRWSGTAWVQDLTADRICPNEDVNRNAVIENLGGVQEDMNGNGQLDPRKADVAITMVGSNKTDENGVAVVQIEYGKSLGSWVRYRIAVTAAVSGSEARAYYADVLPVEAGEVTVRAVSPSFVRSPYGISSSCQDPT